MMDKLTKNRRSTNMAAVKARGNRTTELRLMKLLRSRDVSGWRRHPKKIAGKPDFIFMKENVVLFVDGCFWHGCKRCNVRLPKSNIAFWKSKIERNRKRDTSVNARLRKKGYIVVRIKEHQLARKPDAVIRKIISKIS